MDIPLLIASVSDDSSSEWVSTQTSTSSGLPVSDAVETSLKSKLIDTEVTTSSSETDGSKATVDGNPKPTDALLKATDKDKKKVDKIVKKPSINTAIEEVLVSSVREKERAQNGIYFHVKYQHPCICYDNELLDDDSKTNVNVYFFGVLPNNNSISSDNENLSNTSATKTESLSWGTRDVKRSDLVPLVDTHVDIMVLRAMDRWHQEYSTNKTSKDAAEALASYVRMFAFLYAILDFVFWDNNVSSECVSYVMPRMILDNLIMNEVACIEWQKHADEIGNNGLYKYAYNYDQVEAIKKRKESYYVTHKSTLASIVIEHTAFNPSIFRMRQTFLLLLTTQHCGLEEEYKVDASEKVLLCTESYQCLLRQLRYHYEDIMEDTDVSDGEDDVTDDEDECMKLKHSSIISKNALDKIGVDYNNIMEFTRVGCRIGENYQVDSLPELSVPQPCVSNESTLVPVLDDKEDSTCLNDVIPPYYVPPPSFQRDEEFDHELLMSYLQKVSLMRNAIPGQVIEAPPNPLNCDVDLGTLNSTSSLVRPCRSRKLTPQRLYILCLVLSVRPMAIVENSSTYGCDTVFVTVYDGYEQWVVPIGSCRLVTLPDDRALAILHHYAYNVEAALKHVEDEMFGEKYDMSCAGRISKLEPTSPSTGMNFRQIYPLWTTQQFKLLKYSGGRYYDDPEAFYEYFVENCALWNKATMKGSVDEGSTFLPNNKCNSNPMSLLDMVDIFLRAFQSDADYQLSNNKLNGTSQFAYQTSSSAMVQGATASDHGHTSKNIQANKLVSSQTLRLSEKMLSRTIQLAKSYLLPVPATYQHNISHIWPYHIIPMAIHSIYMLKRSNCPCLCVGIDANVYRNSIIQSLTASNSHSREDAYMKVMPIDCNTPRRVTLVSPQSLDIYPYIPSDNISLLNKLCRGNSECNVNFITDAMNACIATLSGFQANNTVVNSQQRGRDYSSKTIDFVNAMIDFAIFKLQKQQCDVFINNRSKTTSDTSIAARDSTGVDESSVSTMTHSKMFSNGGNISNVDSCSGYYSKYDNQYQRNTSMLCCWMKYPLFIRQLLEEPSAWASYRKTAERRTWYENGSESLPQHVLLEKSTKPSDDCSNTSPPNAEMAMESPKIPLKLTTRQLYFLYTLSAEREINQEQEALLTLQAKECGIQTDQVDNLKAYVDGFEWGEHAYMLGDYPWDDMVLSMRSKGDELNKHNVANGIQNNAKPQSNNSTPASTVIKESKLNKSKVHDAQLSSAERGKKRHVDMLPKTDDTNSSTGPNATHVKNDNMVVADPLSMVRTYSSSSKKQDKPHVVDMTSVSPYNLYWLDRSSLPCIFYDYVEEEFADEIHVLPICCNTYHYYVKVSRSQIKPLDERNLSNCSDDRTRDFGGAMLDFAMWDKSAEKERKQTFSKVGRALKPTAIWDELKKRKRKEIESNKTMESKLYSWPDFILNLINKPKEWTGWRKKLERQMTRDRIGFSGNATSISRRQVYFLALKEEYERLQVEVDLSEKNSDPKTAVSNAKSEPIEKLSNEKLMTSADCNVPFLPASKKSRSDTEAIASTGVTVENVSITNDNKSASLASNHDPKSNGDGSMKVSNLQIPQYGVYTGEMLLNKMHGNGEFISKNGDIYTGMFKNNYKSGFGKLISKNGTIYEGNWLNNCKNGMGKQIYPDGSVYEGNWKMNSKSGDGTLTIPNGDTYTGHWKNNSKSGQGTCTYKDGSVYTGSWKMDKKCGFGKYTYAHGNSYSGFWLDDMKSGHGTMTYACTESYRGDWLNDKRHGKGLLLNSNGEAYEGSFALDMKDGNGVLFKADGKSIRGRWVRDQMVNSFE